MFGVDVSYVAVLVAAVVGMAIGAFWYSPVGFGKAWMKLSGVTEADMQKAKERGMTKSYALAFMAVLIMAYVTAVIVSLAGALSIFDGAMVGFWIWLGFIATSFVNSVLWEQKPFKLYFINVFHYLVVLKVMGVVIVLLS